jgi:hypothetical protein
VENKWKGEKITEKRRGKRDGMAGEREKEGRM